MEEMALAMMAAVATVVVAALVVAVWLLQRRFPLTTGPETVKPAGTAGRASSSQVTSSTKQERASMRRKPK